MRRFSALCALLLIGCNSTFPAIHSFEECAAAGYPVMESYPEQCRTPDGRNFVREISGENTSGNAHSSSSVATTQTTEVVAANLQIPWDVAFLPSGDMLVTQRGGTLLRIGSGQKQYTIDGVRHIGEGGLLGIALHPDFGNNQWIYLYLTTQNGGAISNRVERYRFQNDALTDRTEILTGIPGSIYHDGGRIAFGPDDLLFVTTGDAGNSRAAQDTASLAGKILRIHDDGSVPSDNPFGNAVYSYGHRNPQGLAWDSSGRLWSTEHGRSGVQSGYDELNLIVKGGNYGWPEIEGDGTRDGMIVPVLHSGPSVTWAPASALFLDGSIFFGGLRGEALYEAVLPYDEGKKPELRTLFSGTFGRIRTVTAGPDGSLYFTTSNRDGRGSPAADDDRIVRLAPD
ncbi:PQQ-dependent sugar dehydrogenase [Candidatus Peregrinibacteria bacterium]|nr:PQQ-dependent sugar dehydrogenase [Candidatus Peregrinibacteria bacterium]